MDSFNMTSITESLLGIDKDFTVNAYLKRDKEMHLNPNDQIYKALVKLGYLNVNTVKDLKEFSAEIVANKVRDELANQLEPLFKNKTINEIVNEQKDNIEYQKAINNLNHRVGRAFVLSKFIGSNNIEEFYNSLTLHELVIIGY